MTRREAEIAVARAELERAECRHLWLAGEAHLLAQCGEEPAVVLRAAQQAAKMARHDVRVCAAKLALAESEG